MKILAIGQWHDSSVSTYDSKTKEFKYYKEERLTNNKHDCYIGTSMLKIGNFKPDIICIIMGYGFKTNSIEDLFGIFNEKSIYSLFGKGSLKLKNTLINLNSIPNYKKFLNANKIYWIHHDYAHILSGWIVNQSKPDYGIAIDGGGCDSNNKLILKDPFDLSNVKILFHETENNFGRAMTILGQFLKIGGTFLDRAGKIMGLQSYGTPDPNIFPMSTWKLKRNFLAILNDKLNILSTRSIKDVKVLDFVASFHKRWKDCIVSYFGEYVSNTATIVYSGGCVQNTVTNWDLYKKYDNITFIPHCYDGGLSIGAMGLMMLIYDIEFPKISNYPYIQEDIAPIDTPSNATIKTIAKLLADGNIIGWYQGHGECGPRALGNRSILMHPGISNGKDILNSRVKHREWWRPFAPSIMEEHAHEWFDIEKNKYSKHMMIAIPVNPDKADIIPSVVHEDDSSRIQTVSVNDNKTFYKLLNEFYKLTGIPLLLNTSLNMGGDPIMGHPDQAIEMLSKVDIDAMCVGNEIHYK